MYCENCQREVASTKNPHTGLLQCSHCGTEKRSTVADANSSIAETAHALLKRWEQSRGQNEDPAPEPRQRQPLSVDDALAAQSSRPETNRSARHSGIDITAELLENADSIQAELESSQQRSAETSRRGQQDVSYTKAASAPPEKAKSETSPSTAEDFSANDLARTYAMQKEDSFSQTEERSSAADSQPRRESQPQRESQSKSPSLRAGSSAETRSRSQFADTQFANTESANTDSAENGNPSSSHASPSYKEALMQSLQPAAEEERDSFVPERLERERVDRERKDRERKADSSSAKQERKPEQKARASASASSSPKLDIPDSISSKQQTTNYAAENANSPAKAPQKSEAPRPQANQRKAPARQGQVRFAPPAGQDTDFDVQQAIERHHRKQRNWSAIIGQLLALGGAVCMTGGIAVVIGNRFGSLEVAETTGWLAMAGGHLLFILGIYTHLTSRVEQIWQDVHHRSDDLARILLQQQRSQQMLYRATNPPPETGDEYGMSDETFERQSLTRSA